MKEKITININGAPVEITKGTRILLHSMNDNHPDCPYYRVPSGAKMTVEYIDDMNQLHGRYDSPINSSLAIIPEIDDFEVISD